MIDSVVSCVFRYDQNLNASNCVYLGGYFCVNLNTCSNIAKSEICIIINQIFLLSSFQYRETEWVGIFHITILLNWLIANNHESWKLWFFAKLHLDMSNKNKSATDIESSQFQLPSSKPRAYPIRLNRSESCYFNWFYIWLFARNDYSYQYCKTFCE